MRLKPNQELLCRWLCLEIFFCSNSIPPLQSRLAAGIKSIYNFAMIEHESQHLPPWSMELPEDEVDLLWLQVNLGEFWPVVEQGCREIGRGALVATIPDAALQSETMAALYMQAAK